MKSLRLGSFITCFCVAAMLAFNVYATAPNFVGANYLLTAVTPPEGENSEPLGDPVEDIPTADPYPENYVEIGQVQMVENSISDEMSMWGMIFTVGGGLGLVATIMWIIAGATKKNPQPQGAYINDDERPMRNREPQQRRQVPQMQNNAQEDYNDGYANTARRAPQQTNQRRPIQQGGQQPQRQQQAQRQQQRPMQQEQTPQRQQPQRQSQQRPMPQRQTQQQAGWDDLSSSSSTSREAPQRQNYNDGYVSSSNPSPRRIKTLDDVARNKQNQTSNEQKKKSSSAYDTQEILNEFFK